MSGQVNRKRFEKHFRIGVRFENGNFVLLNGQPLPKLANGSVGELVIAPECIEDVTVREGLKEERRIPFLEKGAYVLLGMSPTMIGDSSDKELIPAETLQIPSPYSFVPVKLDANLSLQVRGDQEAKLSPCSCTINALDKKAKSLNHAFTLISEAYETLRLSHLGNVFERAYSEVSSGKWQSLDELRIAAIARMQTAATKEPQPLHGQKLLSLNS